ncbi:MAG: BON domain-containing protein [Candidatus Eisenbacteria bacterium]|nr:BON domain-containing protein [Candidatus Eisenbacteria bacterium]
MVRDEDREGEERRRRERRKERDGGSHARPASPRGDRRWDEVHPRSREEEAERWRRERGHEWGRAVEEAGYGEPGVGREGPGYGMIGYPTGYGVGFGPYAGFGASYGYGWMWGSGVGPWLGYGPLGYRRSDESVREDVIDRLTENADLNASDIEVAVHDGEVRLRGQVEDRYQKRLAEDLAESISGVWDVHNEMSIRRSMIERPYRRAGFVSSVPPLREGMEVRGYDGGSIGRVKRIRDDDFLLDRRFRVDLYVPLGHVRAVRRGEAILDIPGRAVEEMGWMTSQEEEEGAALRRG